MARKKKAVPIRIYAEITQEDLIETLVHTLSFDEIHKFIVNLDKACEDWGVTERLFKHFQREMKKLNAEERKTPCEIPFQ